MFKRSFGYRFAALLLAVILAVFLATPACAQAGNSAPVITVIDDTISVREGRERDFGVTVEDPDGDNMTFQWTHIAGEPLTIEDVRQADTNFTAPYVTQEQDTVVRLRASDGVADTYADITVTVRDSFRGGGPYCFVAGTPVTTEKGLRSIEEVMPGERVLSCDTTTGLWSYQKVLKTFKFEYDDDVIAITAGGEQIKATGSHPFWVLRGDGLSNRPVASGVIDPHPESSGQGRWVKARDLKVGDRLRTEGGSIRVESLSRTVEKLATYNLMVANTNTYTVGRSRMLVHNCTLSVYSQDWLWLWFVGALCLALLARSRIGGWGEGFFRP